ncbi:uncharacterized protein B0T15DRAFT_496325 [Chaetomium strumarium]|uniref:Uncharacterized protein n=1 Tax=Chaetomium strumarium TaxID=1170767 RepID=A0AAJ0GPK7_9PEZI|nr:hypothetical protein B0T15DRAFT_496325 [Chaetomium strumarium]
MAWSLVVQQYSNCDLTIASDKLIALSGVAHYHQRQLLGHDTYLAGLWRKTFIEELSWVCEKLNCRRVKEYRAPPWSWAAVDGPVTFANPLVGHYERYDNEAEIIDIRTELLDPGNSTAGVLAARAPG